MDEFLWKHPILRTGSYLESRPPLPRTDSSPEVSGERELGVVSRLSKFSNRRWRLAKDQAGLQRRSNDPVLPQRRPPLLQRSQYAPEQGLRPVQGLLLLNTLLLLPRGVNARIWRFQGHPPAAEGGRLLSVLEEAAWWVAGGHVLGLR